MKSQKQSDLYNYQISKIQIGLIFIMTTFRSSGRNFNELKIRNRRDFFFFTFRPTPWYSKPCKEDTALKNKNDLLAISKSSNFDDRRFLQIRNYVTLTVEPALVFQM